MRGATTGIVIDPADRGDGRYRRLRVGVVAFLTGAVAFFLGSAIFLAWSETPPSATPLVSVLGHAGWFAGVACLAVGAVSLIRGVEPLGTALAGQLAVGALALGTLTGLQWVIWSYVDVLAAQHDQYGRVLESLISPFGTGLALMYGLLVGAGVAWLGWGLRRAWITRPVVARAGVALGTVEVLVVGGALVTADRTRLFAVTILLLPIVYLWAAVVAVDAYRRWQRIPPTQQ